MNIFLLELRNLRKSALTAGISIAAVILAMLAFFPSMQSESMQALAGAKMEGMDPALLAAFGLSELVDFSQITNFFGYALQFITLALMVVLTQQAVGLLIKEETEGTIEFLFARPVSRTEIFTQKLLAHIVVWISMCAGFFVTTVAGYLWVSDYSLAQAVRESGIFYGAIFFVGLVFSAGGVLLSTCLRSGRSISGVTIALVFGTFILGLMSVVVQALDFLVWFSPMDWIKSGKLMSRGILPEEWLVGTFVILVSTAAAWLVYRKKDFLV